MIVLACQEDTDYLYINGYLPPPTTHTHTLNSSTFCHHSALLITGSKAGSMLKWQAQPLT